MKKRLLGAAGVLTISAALLVTGPSVAMSDTVSTMAQTEAFGSQSCGPDERVYVSVTLNSPGDVKFYQYASGGAVLKYTSNGGSFHTHTYASRSMDWKVSSNYIATATDGCTSNW